MTTPDATWWEHRPTPSTDVLCLRPEPRRAAVALVPLWLAVVLLRAAATGSGVIDDGTQGNVELTRIIGLFLGLSALLVAVGYLHLACRVRTGRRVRIGPGTVEPGLVVYPLDGFDVEAVARASGVPVEVA